MVIIKIKWEHMECQGEYFLLFQNKEQDATIVECTVRSLWGKDESIVSISSMTLGEYLETIEAGKELRVTVDKAVADAYKAYDGKVSKATKTEAEDAKDRLMDEVADLPFE